LWRFLGSTRLALILLLALLLALLVASLFPQMPTDPALRQTWLKAVALRYGPFTGLLHRLGLFDAFHSLWYLALLAALLLNTLICTVQRLPRLWRSLTTPPTVVRPDAFYQGFAHRAEWEVGSLQEGVATAQATLRRHRYRVKVEHDQEVGCATVYAERGRWGQAATAVSHLAALILLLAVGLRPVLSWQEGGVTLLPGQVYQAGHGTGLSVRAGRPAPRQEGAPGFEVPLAILPASGPAITETVGLNHPLTVGGLSFHLQGYGPAAQISAPEGTTDLVLSGSEAHVVTLSEAGVTLQVAYQPQAGTLFVDALAADGQLLGSGSVDDGQQIEAASVPITFYLTDYSLWQVGRDPTFAVALTGAGLFLVTVLISLWIPHRRLWLRLQDGQAQMVGSGDWGSAFDTLSAELSHVSGMRVGGPEPIGPEVESDG
jgi:cytochrome c biogenesis protein